MAFCSYRCCFLLAVVFGFGGFAFGQTLQNEDRGETVRGVVINAMTRAPIPRALVHSVDNRYAMLTDSDGRFEFALPKANSSGATSPDAQTFFTSAGEPKLARGSPGTPLYLQARKPGFLDESNDPPSLVSSGGEEVTIALVPEAFIQGKISLSTGEPALGIGVELYAQEVREGEVRWVPRGASQANSNGEFRFAELTAGAYKLLTREQLDTDPSTFAPGRQMFGFAPVFYPGAPDFSGAGVVQLVAGQTLQADFSLTHQPYYPVKIPVPEAEVGGINISVSLQGKRSPGYSLGYSEAEHQIEGQLPNGNYVVELNMYGTNARTGSVNLRVAGAAAEGPILRLSRSSSVTLDVKEEFSDTGWNGAASWSDRKRAFTVRGPRSYLFVRLDPADDFGTAGSAALRPPTGPDDASLMLENVPPGRYWVRFNVQRGYVAAASAGGADLLHTPLVVGSGANIPVDVTMRDDFAEITGTVSGLPSRAEARQGGSAPLAWVYFVPSAESGGQFLGIAASSEGTFEFSNLAPGSYRVMAFSRQQPELPYRDAEAMRAYDGKGEMIHVSGGQKANVQVQIIP